MATLPKCKWCGTGMHAIQYHAIQYFNLKGEPHAEHASVCLVCPRCDSPADAKST